MKRTYVHLLLGCVLATVPATAHADATTAPDTPKPAAVEQAATTTDTAQPQEATRVETQTVVFHPEEDKISIMRPVYHPETDKLIVRHPVFHPETDKLQVNDLAYVSGNHSTCKQMAHSGRLIVRE